MSGILSYGAYVPPTRLPLAKADGPERAVAWFDEDACTLGVAAARACLDGFDRSGVDALFFASTTAPFAEKQHAALLARALGLRRALRSADFSGSLRCGLGALRAATDAVAAGSARRVLVVAAETRLAAPGSALERQLGDGAAAFLIGADGEAIARVGPGAALAEELVDVWRAAGDRFVHGWEERFVVQEGYLPFVREAGAALAEASGTRLEGFDRVALAAPDARSHAAACAALGVAAERRVDPLYGRLGAAGAAFAPLLLAAALEQARPGERVAVIAHGDGAEALALETCDAIEKLEPRRGVAWHLARRRGVTPAAFRRARDLEPREWPSGADPGLSATVHFRERDADLSFVAQQCEACGGLQFPKQRVCERCYAKDRFRDAPLAERTGRVVTWTLDHFFPAPEPPTVVTVCDVDGARVHLQLADCAPDAVRSDLPVRFVFRRIHQVGGRPNYYWKAVPAEDAA